LTHPDVVVIGGGIIGCACAYYLAKEGVKVHLIEKGALASGASGAGEGGLAAPERPGPQADLTRAAALLYKELADELPLDIEHRTQGTLYIAEDEADLRTAEVMHAEAQDAGGRCELLDRAEVCRLEPHLASDVAGGVFYPDGGQINPHSVTMGMALAARGLGAVIQTFTSAMGIELSRGCGAVTSVVTTSGRIPTGTVVNAAGAWSGKIGKMVGLDIPVLPRKGYVVVTEPVMPIIRCTTVSEIGYVGAALSDNRELSVALEMEQPLSGNLLMGMSREFVGFDRSVSPNVVRAIVARNLRFFPRNRAVHAIRVFTGLRPYTPDSLPIVSAADAVPGFYVATGHEGEGQSMAPITGKLISQLIIGRQPEIPLDRLSLSRFTLAA